MRTQMVYVGLDYHKLSVRVCVQDETGRVLVNCKCANSVMEVVKAVGEGRIVKKAAVESCCGAANLVEALRAGPGWDAVLVHPGMAHRMKSNPDKSDSTDAKLLADLCRTGLLPLVWLAPELIRECRLLIRKRWDLVHRSTTLKTQILGLLRHQRITTPDEQNWRTKWMAWIQGDIGLSKEGDWLLRQQLSELKDIDDRIDTVDARLRVELQDDRVVKALMQHKSVGEVTAWTMRALVGEFSRFKNGKQLARFCALTPKNASSGERVADAGLIKAGDPQLKTVVIQAAQRLKQHHPKWKALATRLLDNGKPKGVVTAAVANRWLRWLFHQMKEAAIQT